MLSLLFHIFSGKLQNRQAADNISSKRQIWIDELRKDFAEFLTIASRVEELRRRDKSDITLKEFDDANLRALELSIRIKLRLNPKEDLHNKLVESIQELFRGLSNDVSDETTEQEMVVRKNFLENRSAIVTQLQAILKYEWERVKSGN